MAAAPEKVEVREATPDQVRPFVERAVSFDTMGGHQGAEELIGKGAGFVVLIDGVQVAGYTVQRNARELHITAAAGAADIDLTELMLTIIEAQAAGNFQSVAFQTKRPGLVEKAQKQGYQIAGYIMRKVIDK